MTSGRIVVRVMELALDLPTEFDAGTTVEYRPSLVSYGYAASDGWAFKLTISGPAFPGGSALAAGINGDADGDAWLVALAAADTAVLTPGGYRWTESVSRAGKVYNPRKGTIVVAPNLALATAGELESHAEVMLKLVRDRLKIRIAKDMARMSAFDRAIEREEIDKLHRLEQYYLQCVTAERRGSDQRENVRAVFVRP